jgi:hypothetical protein
LRWHYHQHLAGRPKALAGWAETTPAEKARLFLKAAEIV